MQTTEDLIAKAAKRGPNVQARLIRYPVLFHEAAEIIGRARNETNLAMNEQAPEYKRGNLSDQVNIVGIRGELIASHHLTCIGVPHEAARLVADSPIYEPDIVTEKHRIDVKAIRPDAPDLLVNFKAHSKKAGKITHYWFIRCITRDTAQHWIFSYATVSKWAVKKVGYTDAYYVPLVKLKHAAPLE